MVRAKRRAVELPNLFQVEAERKRLHYRRQYGSVFGRLLGSIVVISALAVLLTTLVFPVFRVTGSSMEPTLSEGQIVIAVKGKEVKCGDLIAFQYGSQILIKRAIAQGEQRVDMDEAGNLYIDGKPLEEQYLSETSPGICDVDFPLQIPQGQWFVLGDCRAISLDSRSERLGCVKTEQVIAPVVFRLWPLDQFGVLKAS